MHEFGVSGLLYKANVLLYDRTTDSLWSQAKREAVTGPLTGTKLRAIPSVLTTWKRWRRLHPDTLVLSIETGFRRNYGRDPYKSYFKSPFAFLGFKGKGDKRLPEKELVLGIEVEGVFRAYPFSTLKGQKGPITDTVSGNRIRVYFDRSSEEAYATRADGTRLVGMVSYWFVWSSFNPGTTVFSGISSGSE